MTKRTVCPHCRNTCEPGVGYQFNENLSMVCDSCNKIVFPTTEKDEAGIPKVADRRYNANRGYQQQWQDNEHVSFA
jgi:RNase P subunit RPR2